MVRRNSAYDIRCQHDVNTQNVTWTFTSSVDQSTSVLVQCMVYSRNPDVHCRSLLPYFNIARPDFMYTSLQVVWDLLPQSMTQGVLQCSLDGHAVQRCLVFLDDTGQILFVFHCMFFKTHLITPYFSTACL
jgi:hypothetical protein